MDGPFFFVLLFQHTTFFPEIKEKNRFSRPEYGRGRGCILLLSMLYYPQIIHDSGGKMKKIKLFLLVTLFCCAVFRVTAAPVILDDHTWSFLQIGIVPDAVALVPSDIPVFGINAEFFCGMQQRVGIINFQPVVGITDVLKASAFRDSDSTEKRKAWRSEYPPFTTGSAASTLRR